MVSKRNKKILDITKEIKNLDISNQVYIAGIIKGLELAKCKIDINNNVR